MKKLLLILLLAVSGWRVMGATGDIISAVVDTTGRCIDIEIEGLDTSGSFNFGIGDKNDPANALGVASITSKGFNHLAVAQDTTRVAYMVAVMRKAYPNHLQYEKTMNGLNAVIKIRLSNAVFDSDQVVINISSAFYTQGIENTKQVVNLTATNNSKRSYSTEARVVGNWAMVDRQFIKNDSLTLRAVFFAPYNIAAVKFTLEDQHSNLLIGVVNSMQKDPKMGNEIYHKGEYFYTFNTSSLTDLDSVIAKFEVYPKVGDTSNVLKSYDTSIAAKNPFFKNKTYHIDRNNVYGKAYVVISPTGNDVTGVASTDSTIAAANPCLTVSRAMKLVTDYNNANFGRNNADNAEILCKAGTYEMMGGNVTTANTGTKKEWMTIRPYPGVSKADVHFTPSSTSLNKQVKYTWTKLSNITMDITGDNYIIGAPGTTFYLWVDSCVINGDVVSTRHWAYSFGMTYFTNSTCRDQHRSSSLFIRNDSMINVSDGSYPTVTVGCFFSQRAGATGTLFRESSDPNLTYDNILIYNNEVYNASNTILNYPTGDKKYGIAIVNNLFELNTPVAPPIMFMGPNGTMVCSTYNVIILNNTFAGQRCLVGYIEQDGDLARANTFKNNIWNYWANKTDRVQLRPSGVNGWDGTFGINCSGNLNKDVEFPPEWGGVYYDVVYHKSPTYETIGFVADKSNTGTKEGFGDYHLLQTSKAVGLANEVVVPFDIKGVERYTDGAVGAYEYGTPPQPTKPKSLIYDIQNAIQGFLRGIKRGLWR